ncbi:hypothetical protein ACWD45_32495 [Streptomyces rubiginosohelvolus]
MPSSTPVTSTPTAASPTSAASASAPATGPNRTGNTITLHSCRPSASDDDTRAWAAAHLARYTNVHRRAPRHSRDQRHRRPLHAAPPVHDRAPAPARANIIARHLKPYELPRLRHTTRPDTARRCFTARESEHPELGPVIELTALGPDLYQRERDHSLMKTMLRHDHPRYEVTDERTHLLVLRLSDAELHARADRAAARVAPYLAALTADTVPILRKRTLREATPAPRRPCGPLSST